MKATEIFTHKFFSKVGDDGIFQMAASLAYYTALSLSPLLILLITFLSSMGPSFKTELINEIHGLVGGQAAEALSIVIQNADKGERAKGVSSLFGFLTLLISAGGIFQELRTSLNKIFETKISEAPSKEQNVFWTTSIEFLKQKIFNMGMVLTFVFILIISLVISSVISLWLTGTELIVGQIINFAFSTLIFTTLFGAIYYFLPQKKIRLRLAMTSGLITALLFSFGKTLIGLYLGESAVASAYGAAGSMVVLLMWVYYSSIIIFISAEVSHQIEVVQNNEKNF
ncbi:MAG: YihY/virulence factor BrkB family protein [Bdellovibrionales bacterium]|nr:YihY/virulence factor BrkB family protein [Bdellovibrionales bacterium]